MVPVHGVDIEISSPRRLEVTLPGRISDWFHCDVSVVNSHVPLKSICCIEGLHEKQQMQLNRTNKFFMIL